MKMDDYGSGGRGAAAQTADAAPGRRGRDSAMIEDQEALDLAAAENFPAAQSAQIDAPESEYVPALQSRQASSSGPANCPDAHPRQFVAPVERPVAQSAQDDMPMPS